MYVQLTSGVPFKAWRCCAPASSMACDREQSGAAAKQRITAARLQEADRACRPCANGDGLSWQRVGVGPMRYVQQRWRCRRRTCGVAKATRRGAAAASEGRWSERRERRALACGNLFGRKLPNRARRGHFRLPQQKRPQGGEDGRLARLFLKWNEVPAHRADQASRIGARWANTALCARVRPASRRSMDDSLHRMSKMG